MGNSASVSSDAKSLHELTAKDVDGNDLKFDSFKGKVVLVVNVASKCGFTEGDYNGFVELQNKFQGQPFEIVAMPCNQFLKQEPAACADVKKFAASKGFKGVLLDKGNVNGAEASPVFNYLKVASGEKGLIKWNFTKFLVDKSGTKVQRFGVKTNPTKLVPDIEKLLAEPDAAVAATA